MDSKGKFANENLKGGENDVIIMASKKERESGKINYNKKGELRWYHKVSKNFKKGSINTKMSSKGTVVQTSNDQSEDVFNFLADNTAVEFSRIEYLDNDLLKNIIATSHDELKDYMGSLITTSIAEGTLTTLVSHTHNHPEDTHPTPSGNKKDGDIHAYQEWVKKQGSGFKVFIRFEGVTREFSTNGKPVNN